jgi:hypothetical protein
MLRNVFIAWIVLGAAGAAASPPPVTRELVGGDIWRYSFTVPVGDGPNAHICIHRVVRERSAWRPRATPHAVVLLHGDFSQFPDSFGDMAAFLAAGGIDVWGVDARWTTAPAEGADLSDFDAMTIGQRIADTELALTFARVTRLLTGSGFEPVTLSGFSRGAHLAYLVASVDAARPAWQRNVKALAPLDSWAAIDPANTAAAADACIGRDLEQEVVDSGIVDSDNFFQIDLGTLALTDPDGPSPNPRFTNLGRMRNFVGRTWLVFAPTPFYHLAAGVIVDNTVTALRESSDEDLATWLAAAAPHQPWRESLGFSTLLCGQPPLPVDAPLGRITVPLLYIGAAGGYGDDALYTTTLVGSTDVTTLVLRLPTLPDEQQIGHADLLFGRDAPALVWSPLAAWIVAH